MHFGGRGVLHSVYPMMYHGISSRLLSTPRWPINEFKEEERCDSHTTLRNAEFNSLFICGGTDAMQYFLVRYRRGGGGVVVFSLFFVLVSHCQCDS